MSTEWVVGVAGSVLIPVVVLFVSVRVWPRGSPRAVSLPARVLIGIAGAVLAYMVLARAVDVSGLVIVFAVALTGCAVGAVLREKPPSGS